MRRAILSSIAGLLAGAGFVFGQEVPEPKPATPAPEASSPTKPTPAPSTPFTPPPGALDGPKPPLDDAAPANLNYFSFGTDFLLWWIRSTRFTAPVAATDVIGAPQTAPLFGAARISYKNYPLSGLRFSFGYFMKDDIPGLPQDRPYDLGFEGNWFDMGRQTRAFMNNTAPVLVRPFFELNNRRESAFLVAAPSIATGFFGADNTFDFWGGEINMWKNLFYDFPIIATRVDLILGLRYLELAEDFRFRSTSRYFTTQPLGSPFTFLAGNKLDVIDYFATRNQFIGPQFGTLWKFYLGEFDFNVTTKLAVGANMAEILIEGAQLRTSPTGQVTRFTGGLLALPSNIGRFDDTLLCFMPELNFSGSVQLTKHISATMGYNFIFMTRVFRPGYQIDRVIDVTQIPNFPTGNVPPTGFRAPAPALDDTVVWFQGLNLTLQITW